MKTILLVLIPLFIAHTISAQLVITAAAELSMTGNTQLTLQNTDLINNGNLVTGNSMISFTGNTSSVIGGNQPIQLNELEIKKTNNSLVLLQRAIDVRQRILFSSGFLNLNGFDTDLGNSGHLDGEQETARIIGPTGGEVLFNTNLNTPTGSNPANLGVFITSNQDLGNVIIKRGHRSQTNGSGAGASILRYYDIIPENNTNPGATLRFRYIDGELNGLLENSLVVLESQDNNNWTNLGFNSRDVVTNFVEKNAINSFGRFTLSNPNNPLPVHFTLFNANCEGNKVLIKWKTAQEQNSSHFDIERSIDGIHWTVIGNLAAAGNSNTERSYSFTDNAPVQNDLYRIALHDLDGSIQYTSVLRSSCNTINVFNVWPNPVHKILYINIVAPAGSEASIRLFDAKGSLVKVQKAIVLQGSNLLTLDMASLANGVYSLSVIWNSGEIKKTIKILKQ